ncbi:pyrimidine 5'-nucleotidase [Parvularcula sp. IMCC14364]|uniref:pyrimidine 5'-nucleotidase n=1 Tax=Parvularcula sp. IMCC14364 TaxID=3067902 RepID=UPI00274100E6|nr:pyrimidine 5'-nucleotidase [Parvularcula sp. IMCC14364]
MADFSHVETYVFDLDNTLYPADCHLFKQIDARMTRFIEETLQLPHEKARILQKQYYAAYGTTLSGLMIEHQVKPHDFMDYVHDIDLSPVAENTKLRSAILNLPGKRYVFTNGSVRHAENVAGKIGILDLFDGIFDIEQAEFKPKPHRETYQRFTEYFGINPSLSAMFEDIPENLKTAHDMGKTTVLVQSDAEWFADEPADRRPARPGEYFDHVHHVTQDLTSFLSGLKTAA